MANSTVSAIGEIIANQGGKLTATTIAPAIKQLVGSIGGGGMNEMEDVMRHYVIDPQAFEVTVTHDETSDEDIYTTTLVTPSDSDWFNEYGGLCRLQSNTLPPLRVVVDGVPRYSFIRIDDNYVPKIYVAEDTTYGEGSWLALTVSNSNSSYYEIEVLSSIGAGMHSIEMWYEYRMTMPKGFANVSYNGVFDVRDKEYASASVIPTLNYATNYIKMKTSPSYPINIIYANYGTDYDRTTGDPIVVPGTGTAQLGTYSNSASFFCLSQTQSQPPYYHITKMTLLARVEVRQQKNKQVSLVVDDAPSNATISIARAPEFDYEYNSTLNVYSFLLCINVDVDEDWNSIAIHHDVITLDLTVE